MTDDKSNAGHKHPDPWKLLERLYHLLGGAYYSSHLWAIIAPTVLALAVTAIAATVFIWHLVVSTVQTYFALTMLLGWGYAWYMQRRQPYLPYPQFALLRLPVAIVSAGFTALIALQVILSALFHRGEPFDAQILLSMSAYSIVVVVEVCVETFCVVRYLWDIFVRLEALEIIALRESNTDPVSIRRKLYAGSREAECYKQLSQFRVVAPLDFPFTRRGMKPIYQRNTLLLDNKPGPPAE
jgi:hypothetical protein